ncbi:MarR family winged helix-turn-helix transcriptional regulator [Planomonospora venezuelensis]|uniref:DNA-binding MarR family transcriptional regulator n=1 Tax=Planomonospora venezuelensis TaxID=1999 RepID=A0A841DCI6_PLAVE|nr:MarR family transcriptional regulator [Planomonospora venezuelensis]MBB5967770.1 DNA-binding MarR family transcriptional regulator [Planomonospora venezuelensis]GIM62295.1 MarR family transcriptional regulator [Planomonospora venezuelensis]
MSDTGWLDEDEQQAWRAFLRLQGQLTARLNRQLQADSGLSLADYEVLVALTDTSEGRLRPFELQRDLQWEQSRLSHHLTRMQRRDLVRREECPEDGRGAFIVLTETGRQAIEAAAPGHVGAVRHLFFDGLTPDQVTALRRLSDQLLDRLDALPR